MSINVATHPVDLPTSSLSTRLFGSHDNSSFRKPYIGFTLYSFWDFLKGVKQVFVNFDRENFLNSKYVLKVYLKPSKKNPDFWFFTTASQACLAEKPLLMSLTRSGRGFSLGVFLTYAKEKNYQKILTI